MADKIEVNRDSKEFLSYPFYYPFYISVFLNLRSNFFFPSYSSEVTLPELRFEITENWRFFWCSIASATAQGPFNSLKKTK